MNTNFQVSGIKRNAFEHLFKLDDKELDKLGAIKTIVNQKPGFPCRVSLEDAEIGEEVILFPYDHHDVNSPYQSKGPIFIRKNAKQANLKQNKIPKMLIHRILSLRVYDIKGMMIDAKTVQGKNIIDTIEEIYENEFANYIHVHNSGPGCYNCQIDRAK